MPTRWIAHCYVQTLKNALADLPDFHIEPGGTFMTDKFARYTGPISHYRAQRYHFGVGTAGAVSGQQVPNSDPQRGTSHGPKPRSPP